MRVSYLASGIISGELLDINRVVIVDEKNRNNLYVNQFLSKVFSDNPLSGMEGIYLCNGKPEKEKCKPQKIYVYFDKGVLQYCALNKEKNDLITGKVPTNIPSISRYALRVAFISIIR